MSCFTASGAGAASVFWGSGRSLIPRVLRSRPTGGRGGFHLRCFWFLFHHRKVLVSWFCSEFISDLKNYLLCDAPASVRAAPAVASLVRQLRGPHLSTW